MSIYRKKQRCFLNPELISKHLHCSICQEVFYKPCRIECGHTFCKPCILDWVIKSKDQTCPLCRVKIIKKTEFSKDLIPALMIHDLKVQCPAHEKGCKWQDILDQLGSHLKKCELSKSVKQEDDNQCKQENNQLRNRKKPTQIVIIDEQQQQNNNIQQQQQIGDNSDQEQIEINIDDDEDEEEDQQDVIEDSQVIQIQIPQQSIISINNRINAENSSNSNSPIDLEIDDSAPNDFQQIQNQNQTSTQLQNEIGIFQNQSIRNIQQTFHSIIDINPRIQENIINIRNSNINTISFQNPLISEQQNNFINPQNQNNLFQQQNQQEQQQEQQQQVQQQVNEFEVIELNTNENENNPQIILDEENFDQEEIEEEKCNYNRKEDQVHKEINHIFSTTSTFNSQKMNERLNSTEMNLQNQFSEQSEDSPEKKLIQKSIKKKRKNLNSQTQNQSLQQQQQQNKKSIRKRKLSKFRQQKQKKKQISELIQINTDDEDQDINNSSNEVQQNQNTEQLQTISDKSQYSFQFDIPLQDKFQPYKRRNRQIQESQEQQSQIQEIEDLFDSEKKDSTQEQEQEQNFSEKQDSFEKEQELDVEGEQNQKAQNLTITLKNDQGKISL